MTTRANFSRSVLAAAGLVVAAMTPAAAEDGDGSVAVTGDLMTWHKVTVTLDGPLAKERDTDPNPFTDYRMTVRFEHESGELSYDVPGYFAADGRAAESSAEEGSKWRAHLAPDRAGKWTYRIGIVRGKNSAVGEAGEPLAPYDGVTGEFEVRSSDKSGRDFRGRGRLEYVGERYLRFAESDEYFVKAGPDAPETLLAYADFDGTRATNPGKGPLKQYQPHVPDWREGDPSWQGGKGKGLIGALNYLASKGVNAFSFLPYNAGGDGDNVWPFVERDAKLHYDVSKLDQWGIVFDHATANGLYLHFKLQENEMDDDRRGHNADPGSVPESLDGGKLGIERKLYCRELIARFAHNLALNWNIGEENTQSPEEIRDMARYLKDTDPYDHHVVIHTFPDQQDKVYVPLLGDQSELTGASLQNGWNAAHQRTLHWIEKSREAGKQWVVANDEQNPASHGVPPDPGYKGHDGVAGEGGRGYTMHDIRRNCLWGTLMAGGAGVEYYFGYELPENDLVLEDFRSRDRSWEFARIAIELFGSLEIDLTKLRNADALVGNEKHSNSRYCLAAPGELYLVYLPEGSSCDLDLTGAEGTFSVKWFNPREGDESQTGNVSDVDAGRNVSLGAPPQDADNDWLAIVSKL